MNKQTLIEAIEEQAYAGWDSCDDTPVVRVMDIEACINDALDGMAIVPMDKRQLADRFTKLVGTALDAKDRRAEGLLPQHDSWLQRYHGVPESELPPFTIEMNYFKPEVDMMVCLLMQAVDEVEGS